MTRGPVDNGRNAFAHIKSKQHQKHRLKSLQQVVSRERGAPYAVQHLRDTGPIVLTPVDKNGDRACPTAPSLREKTVATVWRIRSLHLSRTEAHYLIPHRIEGVP